MAHKAYKGLGLRDVFGYVWGLGFRVFVFEGFRAFVFKVWGLGFRVFVF